MGEDKNISNYFPVEISYDEQSLEEIYTYKNQNLIKLLPKRTQNIKRNRTIEGIDDDNKFTDGNMKRFAVEQSHNFKSLKEKNDESLILAPKLIRRQNNKNYRIHVSKSKN